ncbi:hypothetical protein D0860_04709 [Hortaea werneckii]|uniref:Zn(2)-C6 fungal-type domain-containing protein n=1 Tax=Hortaea werneckii TaxID=91943 RepID=A0A3M7H4N8_HORWE|nr:hypothetical protein D0860_04709 [Hortaea werneckii]
MPPDRTHRTRQEPVSCDFCRRKKLKCDRTPSCSNCQARSITCIYQGSLTKPHVAVAPYATSEAGLRAENTLIKERLQRLEQAVFGQSDGNQAADSTFESQPAPVKGPRSTDLASSNRAETDNIKVHSADSRWLETAGSLGSTSLPPLRGAPTIFCVDSLSEISRVVYSDQINNQILLPSRVETWKLFKSYEDHLDALQHIIYVPHIQRAIDELHNAMDAGKMPQWSSAALILAITASIAGYWGLGEAHHSFFASPSEAMTVAMYWTRCALDVMDYAWRTSTPDLETIQTSIVLVFLLYHLEGFSPKLRHIHGTAIMKARDIGLHLTDSAQAKRSEETREQIIDAEMRRRVWWHLASTDWSMSLAGSQHEGTYTVQKKHMQVNRPRNITDEDLATKAADFSRPLEETTANSYYLLRIKLAEVCRDAADLLWDIYTGQDPEQIDYDRVVLLDARFSGLLDGLPKALKLEHLNDQGLKPEGVTAPQLMKQSYFTYLTIEIRRSKIHLPYLLRAERNPRYEQSRTQCLASARNVLALRRILPHEQSQLGAPVILIGVLHHFFCAIVVLVMDLCVNEGAGSEEERRLEVQEACKILENARERFGAANAFLESLMTVLRKHGVRFLRDSTALQPIPSTENWTDAASYSLQPPTRQNGSQNLNDPFSDPLSFDTLWQSYFDMGSQIDPQSWNDIFNDLDMRLDP